MPQRYVDNRELNARVTNDATAELHLEDQLELALSDDFNHEGSFAFGSSFPSAPNPGLEINSLGTIGLPLSTGDAELIKSAAARSPFGHGDKLVIDSNVRDTWEIDAAQITIGNVAWDSFMEGVVRTVGKKLGIVETSECASPLKCELYKLLLYETGSHFLAHQDTEKAPGMFATIVVVLPSRYTGGEVRVVQGDEEKMFDFSANSQYNTVVLAWYADVIHEVKPITSGYRFALTYNLMQSGSLPVPLLSSGNPSLIHLRQVLERWTEGAFVDPPDLICYKLGHDYSQSSLSKGASCLKGVDAHKGTRLLNAAFGLGVAMAIGQFELHVVSENENDDDSYSHYKRRKFDDSDSCGEDSDMGNNGFESSDSGIVEVERIISISDLVDFEGNTICPKAILFYDGLQAKLIPKDAFKKHHPDKEEYQGYQGNAPGRLDQWYRRTVLVLYLKKREVDIMLEAGGASYAIAQLKKSDPIEPTRENMRFVDYMLSAHRLDSTDGPFVLDLGILWNDFSLWKKAAEKLGFKSDPTSIGWDKVIAAWDKFGFDSLRTSFEDSMQQLGSLSQQMHVIELIRSRHEQNPGTDDKIEEWCDHQVDRVLSSILPPRMRDVPTYLTVMKTKGLDFFAQSIIHQLLKFDDTFDFIISFVETLLSRRSEFEDSSSSPALLQTILHESLSMAMKQWKCNVLGHYRNRPIYSMTVIDFSRVKNLVEHLISANELTLLKRLLTSVIEDEECIQVKFRDIIIPLIPVLVRAQKQHNIPVDSDASKGFLEWVIETYLQKLLGGKDAFILHPSVRKLSCEDPNCNECLELDRFIQSPESTHVFRFAKHRLAHVESQLDSAPDLASYKTIHNGKACGLEVTKRKDIVTWNTWDGRQKAAKKFLSSFGGVEALKLVMGDRYSDLTKALSGEQEYKVGKHVVQSSQEIVTPITTVAGVKRKGGPKS